MTESNKLYIYTVEHFGTNNDLCLYVLVWNNFQGFTLRKRKYMTRMCLV